MGKVFSSGKHAIGVCDRCYQKYPLKELKAEIYDSRRNGLLVCSTCLDVDHPQLKLKNLRVQDPQGLKNPRPDNSNVGSVPPSDQTALEEFINAYTTGT
jgi:hypothetical protein